MEDIRTVTKLLTKDCFMTTVDLKEAYFLVPIHKSSRKLLRFKFQGTIFEFQCLPFGLSLAPLVFTKLLNPVVSFLRSKGFILAIYLDDIIFIGNTYNDCLSCTESTRNLLEKLGFVINYPKSKLLPKQSQIFLGFELDSREMCLKLPLEKRCKLLERVKNVSKQKSLSIRDCEIFRIPLFCLPSCGLRLGLYKKLRT